MTAIIQIGKNGLTPEVIEALKAIFKNQENVELRILKSCSRDREAIDNIIAQISAELEKVGFFTLKKIGFKIFIKKWRRKPKK
jgi:RNA-binding protein YhbY